MIITLLLVAVVTVSDIISGIISEEITVVTVPSSYQGLVTNASQGTGLPESVVAAQANMESGFNANAVSPAGAEGWLQFLPSTYDEYAGKAGVPTGTEFNPTDETKVYVVFMNQLLHDEGGSIFKALEAYNAGEGNLSAGYGYASSIMSAAGQPSSATAGTPAQTTGINWSNVFGNLLDPFGIGGVGGGVGSSILGTLGIGSLKDLLQRLGLILLGAALILVGLHMTTSGNSKVNVISAPGTQAKSGGAAASTEAAEAAAV